VTSRSATPPRSPADRPPTAPASSGRRALLICVGIVVALVAGIVVALLVDRSSDSAVPEGSTAQAAAIAARPDSHRLSDVPAGRVTFVEFLDFECEACGAYFPYVEQLREEYGDRVSFVVRYFPISSHYNAERAARAVQAAAGQGKFEQMYQRMYQTQSTWAEQRVPMDETFRGFAVDLGLDMAAWDAAYQAPATLDRINADVADGQALGVQGTPTFFVNGTRLQPQSYQDLTGALDAALG
jgi:protein-disulfide isomerase